ncbi:MAG: hypothetical protein HF981_13020 [Desulfobacteraceae bacterium]|nr:hypothetical protein [Desulfobacteraceae bacterium]MBC2751303.1 hypothetical protein [Desulfobacteraceae bacterium]
MRHLLKIAIGVILVAVVAMSGAYFYLPVNRVDISSELIMLGDLNNDNRWDAKDRAALNAVLANPFRADGLTLLKMDLNRNGMIDSEDRVFLDAIYHDADPYLAEQRAKAKGAPFPRPRELFKYLPTYEYAQRPLFLLAYDAVDTAPLSFLRELTGSRSTASYQEQLLLEIYDEALRFSRAHAIRANHLTELERQYVTRKIRHCETLFSKKAYHELLLELISLVEDAETLTTQTQSDFIRQILYFRDKLRDLLVSEAYQAFEAGGLPYQDILKRIEAALQSTLDIAVELDALPPPRDYKDLENYLDRAEWQAYKSKTRAEDFKKLVLYAQYDRRYLRAVSRTTPKHTDIQLQNHNLPMVLLFREALAIKDNDKKAAAGLLDEAVRIPLGWVKSIPKDLLPGSIALENFLLPGNKEDGSDKSRHWNVFGGVAIYKSPRESLILSLRREIMDLRDQDYAKDAMQEFIRDTIANINGIYYVVSIDPDLLGDMEASTQ